MADRMRVTSDMAHWKIMGCKSTGKSEALPAFAAKGHRRSRRGRNVSRSSPDAYGNLQEPLDDDLIYVLTGELRLAPGGPDHVEALFEITSEGRHVIRSN